MARVTKEIFEKRIEAESELTSRITNNKLLCKDCEFVMSDEEIPGNVSRCEVYDSKPNSVFLNKGCPEYLKRIGE